MKKILVLGGTRLFGQKLVQRLIDEGHEVTIMTRGNSGNPFGAKVTHLIAERQNEQELQQVLANKTFDIVYDNICYTPAAAIALCNILNGNIKKLIFTSTMSTYELDDVEKTEQHFDPYTYPIQLNEDVPFTYGERKRMSEAAFYQHATFPVVSVRFPIVLDEEDYTKRLHFYVEKIIAGEAFELQNLKAKTVFIHADEAAEFLHWIGEQDFEGPINANAEGTIEVGQLIQLIEQPIGKQAQIILVEQLTMQSPYSLASSWYMSNARAVALGFNFSALMSWLPNVINNIYRKCK